MSNKMNKEKSDLYMGRDMNNIRIRMEECGKSEIYYRREVSVCYKCTIDLSCDRHLFIKHKNEYSVDSTMWLHHRGIVFNGDGTCEFYVMGRAKCSRQDKFDEAKGFRLARLDANIHAYKRGCAIIKEHLAMLEQYIRHFDDTNELFKSPFVEDVQKMKAVCNLTKKISPSDISTIFNKLKVKGIINGSKTIEYEDILLAIFEYEGKNEAQDKFIIFLNTNGVSQAKIAQKLNVSARLVRNVLSKK